VIADGCNGYMVYYRHKHEKQIKTLAAGNNNLISTNYKYEAAIGTKLVDKTIKLIRKSIGEISGRNLRSDQNNLPRRLTPPPPPMAR